MIGLIHGESEQVYSVIKSVPPVTSDGPIHWVGCDVMNSCPTACNIVKNGVNRRLELHIGILLISLSEGLHCRTLLLQFVILSLSF